jgi:predicted TIM-barrel fold metal-dependent hydrolase
MKIIDTHVHLGDIYEPSLISLEERTSETTHPGKPNTYEQMGFGNIYLGRINYLFKPLVASSARSFTRYGNLPNLEESMKKTGIERSIILALEPYVSTDSVLSVCRKNNNLIPFCSVHPKDKDKKEKLSRYVGGGCKGLKVHPVIQEVSPDDPATFELIEEAKIYNIPILFHVGWGSLGRGDFGFPERYQKLLNSFSKVTLIFAHIGFYEPFTMLEMIENHPNVYCDTSWQPAGVIKKAIDKLGEERLIYGSDWPFSLQKTSLNIILKVTKGNPELRDKILYKNAERLIKDN